MHYYLKKAVSISSILGITLLSTAATAAPAPLNEFKILDFRFGMEDPSFGSWETAGGATPIDPSQYGTLIEGTYQGTNKTNVLVNFEFFNSTVHVSTSAVNFGNINTPAGSIPGGPEPTIDLVGLTADMSSWFAEWNGTDFNQGNNSNFTACTFIGPPLFSASPNAGLLSPVATVTDNLDGTYRINWNSCITGGAFNGKVGFWQLDLLCTTCPPTVLGAADILTVSQASAPNSQVATISGGNIVVSSSFGANPAGYNFNWKTSDPAIVDIDGDTGTFTFDPSGLSPGNYVITALFEDTNTVPTSTKGSGETIIRLESTVSGDIADTNANRISNKDDAGLLATQLQAELGTDKALYALESSSGSLRLGKTAFCAGKAARITQADIEANASKNCTATVNSSDNLLKAVGIGGYYDFEVTNISQGETVDIVIPLTASIPDSAVYRKYSETGGWKTFITEDNNKLSSAKSISDGVCPSPTSNAYSAGLKAGHNCLRLSITDGGPNDADNSPNGLIKDPGGVAEVNSGTEATLSGCSISGQPQSLKEHAEWLLLFAAIIWLGMTRRSSKQ